MGSGSRRRPACRRAAPSRAHRCLHGGESSRREGNRHRSRWHRLWSGRHSLGRGSAPRGLLRLRTRGPLRIRSAAGGAAAIHEPWRTAISYLTKHYGQDLNSLDIPLVRSIDARKLQVVQQMIDRQIHSPRTSSCGRLFDAVAALAGVRAVVNYEAQAAIEFEMAAHESADQGVYPFDLIPDGTNWIIGTLPMFQWLLRDIRHQEPVGDISRRFHAGLAATLVELAENVRAQNKLGRVCLSGGCF